jgi:hypothetical protein
VELILWDIGGKSRRKETTRKAKDVGGWLKWIGEIRWSGLDWIDLAQDRDQWRALMNTAMNLRNP